MNFVLQCQGPGEPRFILSDDNRFVAKFDEATDDEIKVLLAAPRLLEACRIAVDDISISGPFVNATLTVDEHQFIQRAIDEAGGEGPILTQTPAASLLSPQELATVLAGLRQLQRMLHPPYLCGNTITDADRISYFKDCFPEQFHDVEPLLEPEIDALCERLNA